MNPSSFDVPPPPCHKRWGLCRRMNPLPCRLQDQPSREAPFRK
nr:MAG TPA: hypothetical protein [Caudoviricetes sp.]